MDGEEQGGVQAANSPDTYVLVLGGSNFMGKDLLTQLAQNSEQSQTAVTQSKTQVYVVNRGKSHWNNEATSLYKCPNIHFYYGDRDCHVEYGKLLKYLSEKLQKKSGAKDFKWDLVVDYCGYLRKEVKSCIRGLWGFIKLYVFISTDSIYDVCDQSALQTPVKEDNAVRPTSNSKIKELAEDEEYGHDKLRCEEYLENHCLAEKELFPYLCLRLPDVIGPYDSTARLWTYVLWLANSKELPIHTKKEAERKPLSFVFSKDITALLLKKILPRVRDPLFISQVHGQSFNISCEENPTLNQFLHNLADTLRIPEISFVQESRLRLDGQTCKGKFFYPSVYCPHLDISKAKRTLSWTATPLKDCLRQSCEFFVDADKYTAEFKKVTGKISKLKEYAVV